MRKRMEKILKSFLLLVTILFLSSSSCEDKSPKAESIDFQLFHHVPGSCPTYFFSTLDTHESHIPTQASNTIIESFLQTHPNATQVKVSIQKTGKVVQHACGDREANPELHPFIEIEVFSMTEI